MNWKEIKKQTRAANLDSLTGILKKNVAEERIASIVNREHTGTIFLCDVNRLRKINNQYGHLAGDECLKQVAQILDYMTHQDDILGRYGGDEFLIFMPSCRREEQALEICRRIEKRFRDSAGRETGMISPTVTVTYALCRPEDTYKSLLGRIWEETEKQGTGQYTSPGREEDRRNHYIKDVKRVRRELIEQIKKPGAFCQNYETFKGIYRFLERGLIRSGQEACVILLTVVDEQGGSLLPYEKDALMERLGEYIGAALRIGDVYTRYSSSQYLVLVIDTTEGQAGMIAERIKERFLEEGRGKDILIHHCYELQPARFGEEQE